MTEQLWDKTQPLTREQKEKLIAARRAKSTSKALFKPLSVSSHTPTSLTSSQNFATPPASNTFPHALFTSQEKAEASAEATVAKPRKRARSTTTSQITSVPTTLTTVVTTTTTTTTTFPPLVVRHPSQNLDKKMYPMVDAPTPNALRVFKFDMNGQEMWFREQEEQVEHDEGNDDSSLRTGRLTLSESGSRKRPASPANLLAKINSFNRNTATSGASNITSVALTTPPAKRRKSADIAYALHGETRSATNTHSGDQDSIQHLPGTDMPDNAVPATPPEIPMDMDFDSFAVEEDSDHGAIMNEPVSNHTTPPPPSTPPNNDNDVLSAASSHDDYSSPSALPSPSLSPTTARLSAHTNVDSYFDVIPEEDTESAPTKDIPLPSENEASEDQETTALQLLDPTKPPVLQIPNIVAAYDALPETLKSYLMFQMLRRTPTPTLQFVSSMILPSLKRDFLGGLPPELCNNILKFMDVKSMCRAAQVNKQWRNVVDNDPIIWRGKIETAGFTIKEDEVKLARNQKWGRYEFIKPAMDAENTQVTPLINQATVNQESSQMPVTPKEDAGSSRSQGEYPQRLPPAANHPYKSIYRRHHIIRRNWREGRASHISFKGHSTNVVTCLQFDDDKIISGSDDQCINIYDTKTGRLIRTLEGHDGGVWALQYVGNTLVSGSTDRTVRVWDIERGVCTHVFTGHTSTVRCLQIVMPVNVNPDPKGKPVMQPEYPMIVTGSRDSTLKVWKLPVKDDEPFISDSSTSPSEQPEQRNPYYRHTLTGHGHSVRALAANGNLVVSGSYDNSIRVWNISTGELIHHMEGHSQKVYSVVMSPDRKLCMSGSMDSTVRIWNLEDGTQVGVLEGHAMLVGLLGLSSDSLVSAAADSTLRIWSTSSKVCKHVLSGHQGAITCFQHDDEKVISGSEGGLKLWDLKTGQLVRDLLTHVNGVWRLAFDERRCVAAVHRNQVTWFEVLDYGVHGLEDYKPSRMIEPDDDQIRRHL
ncbi:hypothetical protein BZG36_04060 [Bifiguratus adelaidae]|uniref:F-box domain-containing protein n=1 Tax=Bifiguratus adelaidae TaxID=1938954 RepID=A0A261XWE3_9FUNG|nr:hypothetical protein BZG36_04060 [Bifiguratus adelaidae]